MESYQYKEIETKEEHTKTKKKISFDIYFCRQLFIVSTTWTTYYMSGLSLGASTVVIAQMRREANSDDAISIDLGSWMTSMHSYAALFWIFLWVFLAKRLGRKITFAFAAILLIISFTMFYFSTTTTHILIGEVLRGGAIAANLSISLMVITEYSSPKHRGFFLTIKSASISWGLWCANIIGTFFHWKNIGLFALICSVYLVTVVFWCESPYWLVTQGRFEECSKNHHWLRGTDADSEKELEKLIETHKEYLRIRTENKISLKKKLRNYMKIVFSKQFLMPLIIGQLVISLIHVSGKLSCQMYAIQILKKITNDENKAYIVMLFMDAVTAVGMYFGCFLANFIERRKLLLRSTVLGIIMLFIMSLYFYLNYLHVLKENGYISVGLMAIFSLCISLGPLILSVGIYGELIPTQFKNLFTIISILIMFATTGTVLKITPYIFRSFNLYGTFLFYAIASSVVTGLLYKYMPETKDRTLQEIEDSFK